MEPGQFPSRVTNWINGRQTDADDGAVFVKKSPVTGLDMYQVARSGAAEVHGAIAAARRAQPDWADTPPVHRGLILHDVVQGMKKHREQIAHIVAGETGKSFKSALGETDGAIELGLFMAGEGQRLYGRTTTSGGPNRYAMTVRQPIGVAGLIIAANTPIANVAWKVFPALICGNTAVLKAAEDAPLTAWFFGEIGQDAGLPPGVLNIVQGYGEEAGGVLVEHPDVDVISFTGSTAVGRHIAVTAANRLARVSLELGGKNPFVVCDDADQDNAVKWALMSAFSNAGQRCAAGSRIIVFEAVYEQFRDRLVARAKRLKVGPGDEHDLGPVINERQLNKMVQAVAAARDRGAVILTGGERLTGPEHRAGYYMAPTLLENVAPRDPISITEVFGPIACLYRVRGFEEALDLANDSPYGLTACIHTSNFHRAVAFSQAVHSGVAVVNAGTYGSEPHMPFGGRKQSGNGSREPGTEALDVYSELKDIYLAVDPAAL
jgi:acyl-CoA reductase-like NAD-dependent aldehyde dehydrogenase